MSAHLAAVDGVLSAHPLLDERVARLALDGHATQPLDDVDGVPGQTWVVHDPAARMPAQKRFRQQAVRVKVMSASGSWSDPGPDVTPTCITCHKAHGNGNAFGLIFRSGRGAPTEDGDTDGSSLQDLCGQCHLQGSAFAEPWRVSGSVERQRPAG